MKQQWIRNINGLPNLWLVAMVVFSMLSAACVKDPFTSTQAVEGTAWVDFSFGTEENIVLSTKAHQSAASENLVSDLFVFIFDASGNKIYDHYYEAADMVQDKATFNSNANRDKECWYVVNSSGGATPTNGAFRVKTPIGEGLSIYCVTNMDTDRTYVSSALLSRTINSLSDLQNFKLFMNVDSVERSNKFTAVGSITGVGIQAGGTFSNGWNNHITGKSNISLRRVDAKIKFKFKQGTRPDVNGQTVRAFTPKRWKIVNIPRTAFLIERIEDSSNPLGSLSIEDYDNYAADYFDTDWREFEEHLPDNSSTFSFYMLENRLQPKKEPTNYWQRSLNVKNAQHKNQFTTVEYIEKNDQVATKTMRNFEYANDFSTYVLVEARVEMDLVSDDAGQVLGADVQYLIHLGGEWTSSIGGVSWDTDTYSGDLASFDTKRNHSYNYLVTVNSVNNIRVEVESSKPPTYDPGIFRENQPGAWGDVTIAKEEIAVCDAHYVSKTLTFHVNNLVKEGTSNADKLTWSVKTPFCDISYDYAHPENTPLSTIDYKWVHFRLNKKDEEGNYYSEQRRKYTPRVFERSATERSPSQNAEGDGTDGLGGYHNDGIMDVVQLVDYIKDQANLYAAWSLDNSKPQSDFDNTITGGVPDPKICVTVFVDEYYYEENPLSLTQSPTLWKRFINTEDRYLHILSDSESSYDTDSRTTGSVTTIQQKSIQSIYNIDETNADLVRAWGLEHIDEHSDIWEWKSGSNTMLGINDNQNGYLNTAKLWNLCGRNSTTFNTGRLWRTYMEIEVPNDTPQLRETPTNYHDLRYSCMTRNRDNNGNGVIDKDELRWYTAAVGQLVNLYMGESCISENSRLYNREATVKHGGNYEINRGDGKKIRPWMQHVISSTRFHDNAPTLIWAEEGIATGASDSGQEGASSWMTIRCCRNLGMDDDDELTVVPEPIIISSVREEGGHSYSVFDAKNLMPASKRDYVSSEMPMHFENNPLNLIYEKFEAYYENMPAGRSGFKDYNEYINTRLRENGVLICPEGWRTPNQREVATMVFFTNNLPGANNLSGNATLSRTAWSMGYFQGQAEFQTDPSLKKNDKYGFIYDGSIITLGNTTDRVRCVRDVRVK